MNEVQYTFGITNKDSANSAMANCSRDPKVVARYSKYTDRAASTAPPPATTCTHQISKKLNTNKHACFYCCLAFVYNYY